MLQEPNNRNIAFVVPSLGDSAAQNEDIVQLILCAAALLEQLLSEQPAQNVSLSIITVEHATNGWKHFVRFFSPAALQHVSILLLTEPAVPNLAIAGHKPAYNLFEFLKQHDFDEVHSLDRYGFVYYPTQARQLGLYFLKTAFVVHIVGGTLFRKEAEDQLLDDLGSLMDDMLERGSVERADVLYVHDRKAWQWYADKIEQQPDRKVIDVAWSQKTEQSIDDDAARDSSAPLALIYYGTLSADSGLPFFCDLIGRALPHIQRAVEVFFVGAAQAIGGLDAVSYIRLRSAKWGVPVTIRRDLALADELDLIGDLAGIVVMHTARRESLRARLIANSGLPVIHIDRTPGSPEMPSDQTYAAVPGRVAQALIGLAAAGPCRHRQAPSVVALWSAGRPRFADLHALTPATPLHMPVGDEPKVSVCITHFSRPQKLRTALASLRRQTYTNFEVIVVDDGSPDPAIQAELLQIKHEIEPLGWRLLVQENRYLGAARNFAASHATGEYLIFMDDDNAAKPAEISTFVAVAQRSGAALVTTFYDAFEIDADLERTTPAMRFTPFGSDPTLGILTNCFGDANALYSRAAFDKLGGFTEDYGITHEDWEFFCRASLEAVKLVCVPEPLFWYRVDQQGMYRGEQTLLHKNANLRRHIRPFLQKLPPYQARLVQLAQGLSTELPLITVGKQTRDAAPIALRNGRSQQQYARVAVITRTKDRPILLRRAVRSVLDQTFRDWLLVIVNDGGNPESVEIVVDELADELAGRVLVLHHPIPLGMQTAANAGLANCDSDFIIIHDDDDSWEPQFLARTVSHLDERGWNPKSGGVVAWSRVIVEEIRDDGEIAVHSTFTFNPNLYNLSLADLAIENRFPPISFLFRRAALEVVGPFREQHGVLGDWDFHLRVLRQFDIDVIPEVLANYHHRTQNTSGVYGNSVHVQTDVHRSKRAELINGVIRGQLDGEDGLPIAQLMAFGELQHNLLAEQRKEFQRLHDYIWTLEQRVKYISSQVEMVPVSSQGYYRTPYNGPTSTQQDNQGVVSTHTAPAALQVAHVAPTDAPMPVARGFRNFVFNGDLRLWPGTGKLQQSPEGGFAFLEISPDLHLCYDGQLASYRVERRVYKDADKQLTPGKTFLHIENDGYTLDGSWFVLEYTIPSVPTLVGQNINISGLSRLVASQGWMVVGGRYHLSERQVVEWPTQRVMLQPHFEQWSCTIACPPVSQQFLSRGSSTKILLKLPYDQRFEFDLTDLQIELGTTPSVFQYRELSRRQIAELRWKQTKMWVKQGRQMFKRPNKMVRSKTSL